MLNLNSWIRSPCWILVVQTRNISQNMPASILVFMQIMPGFLFFLISYQSFCMMLPPQIKSLWETFVSMILQCIKVLFQCSILLASTNNTSQQTLMVHLQISLIFYLVVFSPNQYWLKWCSQALWTQILHNFIYLCSILFYTCE